MGTDRLQLDFGDQGLFSLTHGSNYLRMHDRYNHRFWAESPQRMMRDPAVLHFAGPVLKPAFWRLTEDQERQALAHLQRSGDKVLRLNDHLPLRAAHLPYLRRWWQICARTPSHDRLAAEAGWRMAAALARLDHETAPKG